MNNRGSIRGARLGTAGVGVAAGSVEAMTLAQQQLTTSAPVREPAVADAMRRLSMCVDDVASAIGALQARLGPILTPTPGNATDGEAPVPTPVRSELAHRIHAEADRAVAAAADLRDLLDALEI